MIQVKGHYEDIRVGDGYVEIVGKKGAQRFTKQDIGSMSNIVVGEFYEFDTLKLVGMGEIFKKRNEMYVNRKKDGESLRRAVAVMQSWWAEQIVGKIIDKPVQTQHIGETSSHYGRTNQIYKFLVEQENGARGAIEVDESTHALFMVGDVIVASVLGGKAINISRKV
jgi:hypothetical protein